ncbi:MAG: hypothetical protein ABL929_05715 [Ferruginibacter sp.]|nr:hypothetical protein [Ferruginibacter sp.]
MKKLLLLTFTILFFANVIAQKNKVAAAQTETKTFLITDATAKDLPEGVSYKNNKLIISKSIKYIKSADGRSITYRPNNGTYKFTCECAQGSTGTCDWQVVDAPDVLECTGSCTCVKTITVITPPIIKTNIKKTN